MQRPGRKTWEASYLGPDRKRYRAPRTFQTKSGATAWLSQQRAAIESNSWTSATPRLLGPSPRTKGAVLGDYAATWIRDRTSRSGKKLRPRTVGEYRRLMRTVLSDFADREIASISPSDVREWYSEAQEDGHITQAANAYGLLHAIFDTAVLDDLVGRNPCMIPGAGSASSERPKIVPTDAELDALIEVIDPRYTAAVVIAAWCSTRFGELTELRRKDVAVTDDEPTRIVLSIDRAVTHDTEAGWVVGPTKSAAGKRRITIPPHVQDVVIRHLDQMGTDEPDALLFPSITDPSHHLAPSTLYDAWYPARDAIGQPEMTFHMLRHYGGTAYAQTGATLKEIQDRLGHSTVRAAMIYQHSTGRDADLAEAMSRNAAAKKSAAAAKRKAAQDRLDLASLPVAQPEDDDDFPFH